eukprot:TRINITY_DN8431_c0_g1_i2.p1 TRINITY_DN8431_c0_g1~~TRINITY_DN8431_c0_g1_i2.p1  ORF type:complete len:204 (+),score=36.63 TRINITY_DN8431_c0_g1_i2:759-1370(+)
MARMCTVPGMWERTINISSAAKTFSVTGWKVGWVYGPENIISSIGRCHQFAVFSIATPLQEALGGALELSSISTYFSEICTEYTKKRDFLLDALVDAGFKPLIPQGSYFILVDISHLDMGDDWGCSPEKSLTKLYLNRKDWNFCRWLATEHGIVAIPCSAFYSDGNNVPTNMIRFAFCKNQEELDRAREKLLVLKNYFMNRVG